MLKSEIKPHGGVPTLFIEGEPTSAMAYTTYFEERSCCTDFANAGYRIFFVNASFTTLPINSAATGFSPFRVGVFEDIENPNYSEFEREVYRILAACPNAIIFPRINVSMPRWWVEYHPEETTLTPKGGYREALFSDAFRKDGAELLERFVEHVKASDYSHRVGGWQICGGQTQEWFHHDLAGSLSKAAEAPFSHWIKEKYGEDNATLPSPEDVIYFGDAQNNNENAKRYSLFCNEEVAKTIDHFAHTIKKATNYEQVVGTFYGYSFEANNTVLFGSHALRCVVESENIDFFSSPNAYTNNRAFGIDWSDMMPVDSVKLHGKLSFIECDIRTHLTRAIQDVRPGEYPDSIYRTKDGKSVWSGPPTRELSVSALRKSFAHQITRASAIWWFDMWGGWYDDDVLLSELANMKDIYDTDLISENRGTSAEIAFFADERGYANMFSKSPHLQGIRDTRTAMGNIGAPYDTFMVEDAEKILSGYKAAVFAFPIPSECGKRAIALCEKLGIPYICATPECPALTVDELCEFIKTSGVHIYSDARDVVYVGNGYLALHTASGGKKTIKLPTATKVTAIFGTDVSEEATDTLEFELNEHETALFKLN